MKQIVLILGLMMLAGQASAALKNGPYMALRAGSTHLTTKADKMKESDTVFAGITALGIRLKSVRFEAEWTSNTRAHIKDTTTSSSTKYSTQRYMFQTYYDLPFRSVIRPYLNAGIGATYADLAYKTRRTEETDSDTTFTWNVGAGLGLNITKRISFDLGYRYIDSGKPQFFDGESIKLRAHEGYAGARFNF